MQDDLIRIVCKRHIIETDITLQRRIGDSSICLMRMFPGPETGILICFFKNPILLCRIDERDIAFISLRLFIHELEDALCTSQAHDHRVDLRRDLLDIASKLTAHAEERNDDRNRERQTRE